ncbi:MAG: hypothetical protein M3R13_01560 [Armatimonadota bacterium]|nr:hypothetical protein [Armatimonadota bacterium]
MLALLALVVSGSDLDARIAEIAPRPSEEKWLSIPWRTNLSQARLDSQKLGKPIFMWIMNGHPFGCT